MPLVKTQAEGINLADTFAFSGTVSGAGSLTLLLSATISSPISAYDISSTYINSTYDEYIIQAEFLPTNDGVYFYSRVFVGGTIQDGSIHGREMGAMSSSSYYNDNTATEFVLYNYATLGNAVGEGITINANLQNVNSSTRPCAITGMSSYFNTSGLPNNAFFGGNLLPANRANIVNGLRFYGSADTGGNTIASGSIKLFGVNK
tara:strand:- start:315 stop:926 length:612 start_codon:yes stop_codon:yes gene_type:complete